MIRHRSSPPTTSNSLKTGFWETTTLYGVNLPKMRLCRSCIGSQYNLAMVGSWLKRFYERPEFIRSQLAASTGDVIRWWESRRLFFNLVVGITGLLACVLMIVCAFTADSLVGEPIGMPDGPLLGVFLIVPYALLANVCYTAGWISELLVRTTRARGGAAAFAVRAFRAGITFSIFITLCPAAISWLVFAVALFKGQKHGPPGE